MDALDVKYGDKIVHALRYLGASLTIRLLCKQSRITISDMIDQWIEWHDIHATPESRKEKVNEFLRHFCARNEIPATFFLALASWEFSDSPNKSPQGNFSPDLAGQSHSPDALAKSFHYTHQA